MKKNPNAKKQKIAFLSYIPHQYAISRKRFKQLVNKLPQDSVAVSFDLHSQRLLEEGNAPFKQARSYLSDAKAEEVIENALFRLSAADKVSIGSKNTLRDYLHYQDVDYWSYASMFFQLDACEIIYYADLIRCIIETENPEEIWLLAEKGQMYRTILEVVKSAQIKYRVLKISSISTALLFLEKICSLKLYPTYKKIKLKLCIGPNKRPHTGGNKILVMGHDKPVSTRCDILPVMKELIRNGRNVLFIIGPDNQEEMIEMLRPHHIPYVTIDAYADLECLKRIKKLSRVFYEKVASARREITENLFRYNGIYLSAISRNLWRKSFSRRAIKGAILYHKLAQRVLDIEKPTGIIIPYDCASYARITAELAKSKGVVTTALIPGSYHYPRFMPQINELLCDKVLVSGEAMKEYFIKSGIEPSKISVCGAARWNGPLKNKITLTREQLCRQLKLDPSKGIWLLTTQGFIEDAEIVNMVISLMRLHPDKQMVIKLHPYEQGLSKYLKILFCGSDNIKVVRKAETFNLLASCELVITITSLTALEAMMLKKPVIIMDVGLYPHLYCYIKENAAIAAGNLRQLCKAADLMTTDEAFKKILLDNSERVVNKYVHNINSYSVAEIASVAEEIGVCV